MDYADMFSRNIGLFTKEEQETLKNSKVAIAGLGGVGGNQLVALARAGISNFSIADPQIFQVTDVNRQYGADLTTLEKNKSDVMCEYIQTINPLAKIDKFYGVNQNNVSDFISGSDVVVDAIEYFCFDSKIDLHNEARNQKKYVFTSPIPAFGTSLLVFSPDGPTFEDFTGVSKEFSEMKNADMLRRKFHLYDYKKDVFKDSYDKKRPISTCGLSAFTSAALLGYELVFHILEKREITVVPKGVFIDHFLQKYEIIDFGEFDGLEKRLG